MDAHDTIPPGIGETEGKIITRWLEAKASAGRNNPADPGDARYMIAQLEIVKEVILEREKTIRESARESSGWVNKVALSVAVSVIAAGIIGQVIGYGDARATSVNIQTMAESIKSLNQRVTTLEQNCRIVQKP